MDSQLRNLDVEDLKRMQIPKRYWDVSFERIPDEEGEGSSSTRSVVGKYLSNFHSMVESGIGLILHGPNGVGKSAASVVIAKEFRRRYKTVLFIEAASLKSVIANRESFDEDETYLERIIGVDLLVIDDLAKGVMDTKGFGSTIIDQIIRTRNAHKRATVITSNMAPTYWGKPPEEDGFELKQSTMDTLRECMIPVLVKGESQRGKDIDSIRKMLIGDFAEN